jgi:ATP-dependent RNA helicase DHR2
MPEKVYKKFEGDEAQPSAATSGYSNIGSGKSPKTISNGGQVSSKQHGPGHMNGVKRFRDGSPKSTHGPNFNNDSKKGLASMKEHVSYYQNANNRQQRPSVSEKKIKPQGLNGAGAQKPNPNNVKFHGAQTGQRSRMNGLSKPSYENTASQNLRKIAAELENTRKSLPIWSKKADIRWALRNNDILLLSGETGSGKSTQVPQFLYTEPWCKKKTIKIKSKDGRYEDVSVGGMIAITQPRRVAAITLAQRVAREMGSSLGSRSEPGKVGYAVRFDSNIPTGTKIKFLTEGTLLQEMLRDPNLRQYSAIIVDEIHERSVDVDLIAGFLRQLVHGDKKGRGRTPLKVVIMSATLDLGGLEAFFAKPETRPNYKPGKNHGRLLAPHLWEDMDGVDGELESDKSTNTFSSWEGISSSGDEDSTKPFMNPSVNALKSLSAKYAVDYSDSDDSEGLSFRETKTGIPDGDIAENGVAVVYVPGRQHEVEIIYEVNPSLDYLHNMLQTILKLHVTEPMPGDILAFLTGQEEIESLKVQLETYAAQIVKNLPRMKVLPLYGSLPAQGQQEAFEKVKEKFTRKVVLATNIAETSVTVSGVHFVVDCGKSKVKQYRPRLGMESLLVKPISRVSAIQRAGRAGREAKGKCYRVYTEQDYIKLEQDEKPEILRNDVIEAVLKMKARGVDDVLSFSLMDSPDLVAMEKALLQLHMMDAIDDQGKLTNSGKKMAAFPLPAAYGRALIAAAEPEIDCVLEVIDILACLNTDSEIYLQPKSEEERDEVEEARRAILAREGDVITYLYTMQRYAAEHVDRNEWCRKCLISVRAMRMAISIRKQLRQVCLQQKLLEEAPLPDPQPFDPNNIPPKRAEAILKTFLKAFTTKTAMLGPEGSYSTIQGKNTIAIHPSSVLYGKKLEAIMFLENVYTAKNYAKKVSAIQADWIIGALGL